MNKEIILLLVLSMLVLGITACSASEVSHTNSRASRD